MLTLIEYTPVGPFYINLERYRMTKPTDAELENRFTYHAPPNQERIDAHAQVSTWCLDLARWLRDSCPEGRNLALALTHLEDVRMRANAALACDSLVDKPADDWRCETHGAPWIRTDTDGHHFECGCSRPGSGKPLAAEPSA